jgi:hypothetical protein
MARTTISIANALLGTSGFSEAFRIQIGLAAHQPVWSVSCQ